MCNSNKEMRVGDVTRGWAEAGGGEGRDNQYPGCACDVPSPLYSYSFELNPELMAPLEALGRTHLKSQVTDPALRARLTPDYTIGCKRILLSAVFMIESQIQHV